MATIENAQQARAEAKRLLLEALSSNNGLALISSGDVPRARTAAIVADALLHLADSMEDGDDA